MTVSVTVDGVAYPNATVSIETNETPVTTAPTTPAAPVQPTASAKGTVINKLGETLVDAQGNTYGFLAAPPTQIVLTPFGKPEFTVTSSAGVVSLTKVDPTSTNPSGVEQLNTSDEYWGVAQTNDPGVDLGKGPAPAATTTAPAPTVPATPVNNSNLSLWTPSKVKSTKFAITDWTKIISEISVEGQNSTAVCKIPCPGGHLDWEYNNPEREYYINPSSDGKSPFLMQSDGSVTIHGEQAATPNSGQDVRSGCIATAGNQGIMFAGGYGFYATRVKWDLSAGWWPAFWMLSVDNNFQYSIELDFENWQNMVNNLHCGIANQTEANSGTFFGTPDMTQGNQLGFDYQEDFITFYLNSNQVLQAVTPDNCKGKTVFPIWNAACGRDGSWAGQPPYAGTTFDMNIGQFGAFATS